MTRRAYIPLSVLLSGDVPSWAYRDDTLCKLVDNGRLRLSAGVRENVGEGVSEQDLSSVLELLGALATIVVTSHDASAAEASFLAARQSLKKRYGLRNVQTLSSFMKSASAYMKAVTPPRSDAAAAKAIRGALTKWRKAPRV